MRTKSMIRNALCAVLLAYLPISCGGEEPRQGANTGDPKAENRAPLVQKVEVADWCKEHVVPESICTRCNDELTAGFQAKGDWCKEHGLPNSQCFQCTPALEAKYKEMAPR